MTDYIDLSLTARLAVGLHCFNEYCVVRELRHPDIDAFIDDLWEFPIISSPEEFAQWETHHPDLVHAALGNDIPDEVESMLRERGVPVREFFEIISNLVEIIFFNFYGASDDAQSMDFLHTVFRIAGQLGVQPPSPHLFEISLFHDRHGWGNHLSESQRDDWRWAIG